jgi:L-cystine uptake protein TcyP (sodium:dicarboxylate symporter family)
MKRGFRLPSLTYTAQEIWRLKWANAPFLIANIVLIGLICYRLIGWNDISKDEKKNISYAEIAFSFIGSFVVLLLCCILIPLLFISLFIGKTNLSYIQRVSYLIFYISILLLTPFSSTVLRVGLDNKLSVLQEKIISGFTILSALFSVYYTANVFNGAFFN